MPERLSAKPSRPALEIGVPGGGLERITHRDFILRIEVVVDLCVDLLPAIAVYGGNGGPTAKMPSLPLFSLRVHLKPAVFSPSPTS